MKLSKKEIKERNAISSKLSTANQELDDAFDEFNQKRSERFAVLAHAIEDYNDAVGEDFSEIITAKVEAYNEALSEVRDFASEVTREVEEFIDAKSEKWQESPNGQAHVSMKEKYEEIIQDDLEVNQPDEVEIEEPNELLAEYDDISEAFDELPEGPEV